jgi:nucleoside-triphosphatase
MNIVITGKEGIGKTTVCLKLLEILLKKGFKCGGIFTSKDDNKGIMVNNILTGKSEILASVNNVFNGPNVGKYFFSNEGINFGNEAIKKSIYADILFIDEIGYLEFEGKGFFIILDLLKYNVIQNSVLVVRSRLMETFLNEVKIKLAVFEVTIENRDKLPLKIEKFLVKKFLR